MKFLILEERIGTKSSMQATASYYHDRYLSDVIVELSGYLTKAISTIQDRDNLLNDMSFGVETIELKEFNAHIMDFMTTPVKVRPFLTDNNGYSYPGMQFMYAYLHFMLNEYEFRFDRGHTLSHYYQLQEDTVFYDDNIGSATIDRDLVGGKYCSLKSCNVDEKINNLSVVVPQKYFSGNLVDSCRDYYVSEVLEGEIHQWTGRCKADWIEEYGKMAVTRCL